MGARPSAGQIPALIMPERSVRHRVCTLAFIIASWAQSPAAAQTATSEDSAVLAAVQHLFDAMEGRDTTAALATFLPDARLVGLRTGARGTAVQTLTARQFVEFLGRDQRGTWKERAFNPEVRVSGTLATVWAEYDFHQGGKFSHCGVDAVQLLKLPDGGWKIASIADTFTREGCPDRAK